MNKSNATLKDRFSNELSKEEAIYQLLIYFNFVPEFGAPHDKDPWHGYREICNKGLIHDKMLKILQEIVFCDILKYSEDGEYFIFNNFFELKGNI